MSAEQKRPSPVLLIFLMLPVFGLAMAFVLIVNEQATKNAPDAANLQIDRSNTNLNYPASEFSLPTMTGETVKLSDLQGRVVFLNFWATWCGPCIEELPELQAFAQQQSELENGAVVLAINSYDVTEEIEKFFADNDIELPDVPVLLDKNGEISRQYGVGGMPTTYIIDAEGMVSQMKMGSFTSVDSLYAYLPEVPTEN